MDAPAEYKNFIGTIKERIRSAQYEALKAVNKELLGLYWDIGKMISQKQQELGWGKSVVETIAADLNKEFPTYKGFSASNLWMMVQLYSEYKEDPILQTVSGEIGFSHNILILTKCKLRDQRLFYLNSTKKCGWSYRVLDHQIDNKTYEKYLLGQTNNNDLLEQGFKQQKVLSVKDHFTFDFLELSEKHSERHLEEGLIRNMQQFLLELGGEYSYIGSQYKIKVGNTDFYIDLLLFHRRLQCLVVIELKAGAFKPEYKALIPDPLLS